MPLCVRTGQVVEQMLTDQWFVAMSKPGADGKSLAEQAIEVVVDGRVRFVPEQWVNTYNQWMQEHPGLVHLAPALVGPPDPGLVRPDGSPPSTAEPFVVAAHARPTAARRAPRPPATAAR